MHENLQGDLVFELFYDLAPKTCQHFIDLCNKEETGYAGTEIHRVVPGLFIQAGRVKDEEVREFSDESFHVRHTEIGLLGMCKRNQLKHTNQSQFYVTLGAPLTFLDNQNVVFGRVIQGMHLLEQLQRLDLENERPINGNVKIVQTSSLSV
jgi:peptidyl-prolyl cis-trans isomerase-like 1